MSDDALYLQYLEGDLSAFDKLVLKYTGRLILYLEGLTHDVMDSEDLAIESFAAILLKKPVIGSGNFKAYLFRTARNRALRFQTLKHRLTVFSLDEAQVEEVMAARPENEFLRDERRQAVRQCLRRIDPKLREALWLVYCEDMSYTEAASILRVNAEKVHNWLTRGKQLMKAELAKEGIFNANG